MPSDETITCHRCDNPVMNIKGDFRLKLDSQFGLYCGDCKELINTHGGRLLKKPKWRSFIKNVI